VLVVEDNVVNRKVARATLKGFGLDVLEAENGSLALDVLAQQPVDLIFMDMHMPVMDGVEATRRIRASESDGTLPGRRPIVAMTANVLKEAVEACMEAGMDGFLPKPFARRQMVEVLTRWLGDSVESAAPYAPVEAEEANAVQPSRHEERGAALDAKVFAQLAETMGEDLATLVEDFLDSTESMFTALGAGPERDDVKIVTRHAHTLKSSAAMVGALGLSAQARQLESEGKAGNLGRLDASLAEMRAEFERVREQLPRRDGAIAEVAQA
jgi:CheY-like chemotaxis protein/HPt (histidine-containing phosphotransfer) domain-containing protein